MPTPKPLTPYREILVFLADDSPTGATPLQSAHALVEALGVGRAVIGTDALTGAVEIRFYYDPSLLAAARDFARLHGIPCEIECR